MIDSNGQRRRIITMACTMTEATVVKIVMTVVTAIVMNGEHDEAHAEPMMRQCDVDIVR